MGNYISCTLATPLINNSKAARVILPAGELRQFRHPIKAAELMLECPNFFLVNSQSLHIGRRFSALTADEEVEFGNVYLMFPMKRLNSIVTAPDMASLFLAANSAAKRISASPGNRVLPQQQTTQEQQEQDGGLRQQHIIEGFPMYRLSVCRSRKPMLETILEEPIRS